MFEILSAVQAELNFTYDLIDSDDTSYGALDINNEWRGQIGFVQNRIIDLSIMDLTVMLKRAQVSFPLKFIDSILKWHISLQIKFTIDK